MLPIQIQHCPRIHLNIADWVIIHLSQGIHCVDSIGSITNSVGVAITTGDTTSLRQVANKLVGTVTDSVRIRVDHVLTRPHSRRPRPG
jgi:hydrogenase maturation factor